jgi:hypothetical protein
MDDRDASILTQVAFKAASENAAAMGLNMTAPEHRAVFEEMFSYFTESVFQGVRTSLEQQVAANVVKQFPGTVAVGQTGSYPVSQAPSFYPQSQPVAAGYGGTQFQPPRIKGQDNGPFPDWALAKFAEKGETEVWDNRHMLPAKPRLPWFKSTTGGNDANAYWPPDR